MDEVILITAASSGIGEGIARELAASDAAQDEGRARYVGFEPMNGLRLEHFLYASAA